MLIAYIFLNKNVLTRPTLKMHVMDREIFNAMVLEYITEHAPKRQFVWTATVNPERGIYVGRNWRGPRPRDEWYMNNDEAVATFMRLIQFL